MASDEFSSPPPRRRRPRGRDVTIKRIQERLDFLEETYLAQIGQDGVALAETKRLQALVIEVPKRLDRLEEIPERLDRLEEEVRQLSRKRRRDTP